MLELFKLGDLVSWCGVPGKVTHDYKYKHQDSASLLVEFEVMTARGDRPHTQTFLYDGRLHPWHKEPSLKVRK